ncbi:hypothetical protein E2R60_05100 [Paenibacillus dendritiformis]|uniref:hypothetical protein n=1 Tax=Paenibacillus dendritiformis TaxID=130049 RepID=UPI0010598739|nr:hypothetical protein [Paenibacillus dendritiformis]TDL57856.1 hypothetical protein E2R60_05100 [Paenibacillus dendritiformis]
MNCKCNKCRYEFDIDIQSRVLYEDVEEMYFTCPSCSEHYSITVSDTDIRKKIKQIQKATARGDVNRMKKLKRQVDKMVADLKEGVQRWREEADEKEGE